MQEPEFAIDVPSWWEPLTLPIWRPDLDDTIALRDAIAGHVSVQRDAPGQEPFSRNALVYFADWRSERPLEALSAALSRVRNSSAPMVIVVLPAGAFDSSRREFESKLPSSRERLARRCSSPRIMRAAGRACLPSPRRRRPISSTPEASSSGSTRASWMPRRWRLPSIEHSVPAPAPRFRPLRLAVSAGDSAPDATFEDDRRNQFALHRFRGRDVLLNFWQSWSAPCLTELGRLQRLHQAGKDTALYRRVPRRQEQQCS